MEPACCRPSGAQSLRWFVELQRICLPPICFIFDIDMMAVNNDNIRYNNINILNRPMSQSGIWTAGRNGSNRYRVSKCTYHTFDKARREIGIKFWTAMFVCNLEYRYSFSWCKYRQLHCIHWVLHTNKWTNCISYISLKLYTLKHFYCSYIFR
jgi:hypothetical protein